MKRKWWIAAGILPALYLGLAAVIAGTGLWDHAGTADIIVVPGNTVRADGVPSDRLKSRLEAALQLFNDKRAPILFVSGGTGEEGRDEAAAMAAYLVARGVPEKAIVQDPLGATTAATGANAAKYLRAHGRDSALVATQYFHVARTALALRRNGVRVTGTAHAHYFEWRDIYALGREVVGYGVYWARM